ncbi:MAG: 2OG-Fe(II) oxygenase [Acidiferrobacterales bacterium]
MTALSSDEAICRRIDRLDWTHVASQLDERGHAITSALLSRRECRQLIALYVNEARFRSRVVMQHHAFGRGEYRYFGYPLPAAVASLRTHLYARLAPIAKRWAECLGASQHYPQRLSAFLRACHGHGQTKPTPLLLHYEQDDYNCLHQDLYGEIAFPLQVTIALSCPREDFTGGEFLLTEQRPRVQSRGEAVVLSQGEAVIFPNHVRPAIGRRGFYRVNVRHGVSRVRSGRRYALGIIFHDAA